MGLAGFWGITLLLPLLSEAVFPPADATPVTYREASETAGLDFEHHGSPTPHKYLIETMGGGVGLFDYDSDGFLDIIFLNGFPLSGATSADDLARPKTGAFRDRLYRNRGDGTFQEVTSSAGLDGIGYGMGMAAGDYDNDGLVDLYVTRFGANSLYRNNGDGTFTDVTAKAGVAGGLWSSSAAFVDYDHDGYLDLYVVRYLDWDFQNNPYCGKPDPELRSYCHPDRFEGVADILYRNNGDGTFTDVSLRSGIGAFRGKGLGVAFADYDRDGRIDIYVANDRSPCLLFRNNGDGTFSEVALTAGVAYNSDGETFGGMGVDFQDFNNSGYPDLVVTTLTGDMYVVFENNRDGTFSDVRFSSGIALETAAFTGWGTRFFDFDNDGWKDLFTANSHVMDNIHLYLDHVSYLQPPLLFRNLAGRRFENVSARSGEIFRTPLASRGTAFGDIDNDGDLDIVVSNINGRPSLLINEGGNRNNWLLLQLVGRQSNRFGIGSLIRLTAGGQTQYWTVSSAGSYLSANDSRAHFGLGRATRVDLIEIWWPSGLYQRLEDIPANQILTVQEEGESASPENRPTDGRGS